MKTVLLLAHFATNEIPTVAKVREEFRIIYTDFDASWETFRYVISVDFFSSSLLFHAYYFLPFYYSVNSSRRRLKRRDFPTENLTHVI